LLDVNCERLSANALVKFVVLELAINQGKMLLKHKDLIIRRLKVFNPENVHEIRMVTQLALCVAQIDSGGELVKKYVGHAMKYVNAFSFADVQRVLRCLKHQQEVLTTIVPLPLLMERLRTLMRENNDADVLQGIEQIFSQAIDNFEGEQRTDFESELLGFAVRFEENVK